MWSLFGLSNFIQQVESYDELDRLLWEIPSYEKKYSEMRQIRIFQIESMTVFLRCFLEGANVFGLEGLDLLTVRLQWTLFQL